ncbi:MAG: hypothetical protein JRH01_07290 [Deltaproteobacteria bacterium]|nr:hypothetical protein [Deltaproteobacteria bacterium]
MHRSSRSAQIDPRCGGRGIGRSNKQVFTASAGIVGNRRCLACPPYRVHRLAVARRFIRHAMLARDSRLDLDGRRLTQDVAERTSGEQAESETELEENHPHD